MLLSHPARTPAHSATRSMLHSLGMILICTASAAVEAPSPADTRYGTPAEARAIELAMAYGTAQDVKEAIRVAQVSRGLWLGCPEKLIARPTQAPVARPIDRNEVLSHWREHCLPLLNNYQVWRPAIGRHEATLALAAAQAAQAGEAVPPLFIDAIAAMQIDTQFGPHTCQVQAPLVAGSFGYILVTAGHQWDPGGVPGAATRELHQRHPDLFVRYTRGLFAGETFGVADIKPAIEAYDGGGGFDHGFAGNLMITAAGTSSDSNFSAQAWRHALLACDWASSEPPVRNHNYTAKLVWLLARAYSCSGDARLKEALLDKLYRNILPGVLMDSNGDGLVDGHALRFADLCREARLPGRMWDGHNSLAWYHGMNTWAVIEAYASLRDRGDTQASNELRPYALAMTNNLAYEITQFGISGRGPGNDDVTHAICAARWAIDRAEGTEHASWLDAQRILWQLANETGVHRPGSFDRNIGYYLLLTSATPYRPWFAQYRAAARRHITLRTSAMSIDKAEVHGWHLLMSPNTTITLAPGSNAEDQTISLHARPLPIVLSN